MALIRRTEEDLTIKEIGKIKLNLKHYPGEDLYCDGEVEDELLQIARDCATVEFQGIIEEKKSWPILYHLSALRENIVEWLPIDKTMKVLEVGAGCGAITGALAHKAKEVTCIDLSKKRSMINAYRHTDVDNVTIHVGNFQDVEPDLPCDYDYICLIGVFEYGQAYIQSEKPYEDFLNIIKKHCKKDGHIVIAIENKFGLKYWAGCKEDHLGTYFSGLEDYPDGGVVRTFTRDGLIQVAKKCGYAEAQMFYPYPDYKFMTSIYSDKYLPKVGELSNNMRNFDRDRIQLFDEKRVFDTVIREGQFPLFSNSYMMILGPEIDIQYVKYSNDRAENFAIKTVKNAAGMQKMALTPAAGQHIQKTYEYGCKLTERYADSKLAINKCEHKQVNDTSCLALEYVEGITLEELLDYYLERDDMESFHVLFDEYVDRISYGSDKEITDYDLIFANIIVGVTHEQISQCEVTANRLQMILDAKWTVIDYEWTFDHRFEPKEIAFRAIYCYILENEKHNKLDLGAVIAKLGITPADAEQYRKQEAEFQKYVTGSHLSMAQMREAIGYPVYSVDAFVKAQEKAAQADRIQIYEDTGSGFNEEQSFFLEDAFGEQIFTDDDGMTEINVAIGRGRSALRIDPGSSTCLVYIKEIAWNGEIIPLKGKHISNNGVKVGDNIYAFDTTDPNITVSLMTFSNEETNMLHMKMEITKVSSETLKHMQKRGLF